MDESVSGPSPLAAGAIWVDVNEAMDRATWRQFGNAAWPPVDWEFLSRLVPCCRKSGEPLEGITRGGDDDGD